MKSRNYLFCQTIAALAVLVIVAFAAAPDVEADIIVCFPLDTDPGWSTEGEWAFGVPLGGGSSCGDPTSGYTGSNVYGYNLAGDYTDNMPEYWLTTTALDCSGYENVTLSFWRWLGVEDAIFDHATVEVSNDGSNWTIVWEHTSGSICDGAWIECVYDISAVADDQSTVYIRWTMGPTDGSVTYPGWNIDDVCLLGDIIDDLVITPSEGLTSSGYESGPFTPSSKTYTLTNVGVSSLDWTASTTQLWLDVEPNSGTLNPSDSNMVEVSLNADVNTLLPGDYNDAVTFTNTTSGIVQTRDVTLEVLPIPGEIEVSDSIPPVDDLNMPFGDVFIGRSQTEQITISNTDPCYSLIVTDISLGSQSASTVEAAAFSVTLPGILGGPRNFYPSYLPAGWVVPKRPASKLVIRSGYRALTGGADALLLASGEDPTILRTALAAFPDIGLVDYFDCSSAVPVEADLTAYDVVVVMSNSGFFDATQTGNVLADYVDAGGKVVQAVATFATAGGWELGGRFVTQEGYEPFAHGSPEFFPHSLGVFDDEHPIMDGVTTLTDGLPVGIALEPGAEWVADWDNGTPLVATQGGSVVGINIFAFDSGDFTGDVPLLFHNAIVWLSEGTAEGFELVGLPEFPATIPPLSHIDVNIVFEPTEAKSFSGAVIIKCNDEDEPKVEVKLSGTGVPDYLEIVPEEAFEFSGHPGGPFVPSDTSYQLDNIGPITISWSVVGPNWVDVFPSGGTLTSGESATVIVEWNSLARTKPEGVYDERLMFTNHFSTVVHDCNIILNVHTDPKIWARPFSFEVTLPQGGTETEMLTIGNTGDAPLEFALLSRQTGFTPPPEQASAGASEAVVSAPDGHDFAVAADVPFAPGELLVRFAPQDGIDQSNMIEREAILDSLGEASIEREYSLVPGLCLIKLPEGMTVEEALVSFNSAEGILYAEPDYEVNVFSTFPDDPRFDELWGMHNTGQSGGTPDADIDAPEAWDIATGSVQVVVAVIDSGVDYTHPDLAANMWVNEAELNGIPGVDDDGNGYIDDIYGYDFYNDDGNPMDDFNPIYHGTHCAGTVGAIGNNGEGVVGVCWNVKIMALKFLGSGGSGPTSGAISAVEYSVLMGANLSSNSWGGGGYSQALKDEINAAGAAGMLFVAAAGNDGLDTDAFPHYPSSYDCDSIIAVLSTNHNDNISNLSEDGWASNYGLTSVDLGAPGSDILSCQQGSRYQYLSGTSMATPHTAGACALIWSVAPGLPHLYLKEVIVGTVDPIAALAGKCVSEGRLNVYSAILEAGTPWIEFMPSAGSVAPDSANDVNVIFIADQPLGTYEGEIIISSDDLYTPEIILPVTMIVEPVDFFTELFGPNEPNLNDMAYRTISFVPDESWGYYSGCTKEAVEFPTEPTGGTIIPLGDDDYYRVDLSSNEVSLYGSSYSRFYIGSNGYISFLSGDLHYIESFADHFDLPRISALFDDLDPSSGGIVSWKELDDRIAVTFEDVPEYSLSNTNSFQVEMFFNGKIRITWLDVAAHDGLAGLSEGNGIDPFFSESDLSEYSFLGDLDGDCGVDFADFAVLALAWLTADGQAGYNPACDISVPADNYIDWLDLVVLTDNWLAGK